MQQEILRSDITEISGAFRTHVTPVWTLKLLSSFFILRSFRLFLFYFPVCRVLETSTRPLTRCESCRGCPAVFSHPLIRTLSWFFSGRLAGETPQKVRSLSLWHLHSHTQPPLSGDYLEFIARLKTAKVSGEFHLLLLLPPQAVHQAEGVRRRQAQHISLFIQHQQLQQHHRRDRDSGGAGHSELLWTL